MKTEKPAKDSACADCCGGRRDFLRQAAAIVAAVAAGSSGLVAAELPIRYSEATGREGDDLTYPIPTADGATIDRDNAIILVRFQGKVFAFNLSCPHENAAVRWKSALGRFECSRHDSKYSPDGVYVSGRATRNMDRFPIRRSGDTIVVDVSKLIQSDQNKAAWDGAAVTI